MKAILAFASILLISACTKPNAIEPEKKLGKAENSYIMSSLEDLGQYKTKQMSNTHDIEMARGEAEHFQLLILSKSQESFTCSHSLKLEGLNFEAREIMSYNGKDDVLVPITEEGTTAETSQVKIWLTYRSSLDVTPGKYRDYITFKSSSEEVTIAVEIVINSVTLPEAAALPVMMGINAYMINPAASGETLFKQRRVLSDLLLERRFTPYFCKWVNSSMRTDCLSSPYTWDDPRTLEYLSDPRFSHVMLTDYGVSAEQIGQLSSDLYTLLPNTKQVYYVWDEPTQTNEYNQVIRLAQIIHEVNPNGKVLTTFYRGPEDNTADFNDFLSMWDVLKGATSYYCTSMWSMGQDERKSRLCVEKCDEGQEWWGYVCMSDTPGLAYNSTPVQNRAALWRAYKEEMGGYLYWAVNAFSSLSPLTPRKELPSGDGVLMYPGKSFGSTGWVVSMRLERFADGLEDYDLMKLAEQNSSKELVLEDLASVYKNPGTLVQRVAAVDAFRKKLFLKIQ